jgi:hypothetical protein
VAGITRQQKIDRQYDSAHLEVEQGRKRRPKPPRLDRLCKLCSGVDATQARRLAVLHKTGTSMNLEDLKHFLLECLVYDDLRAAWPAFPSKRGACHIVCIHTYLAPGTAASRQSWGMPIRLP